MIINIMTHLSNLLSDSPSFALYGAFLWGLISVLLSPCHLASIPLVMGFVNAGKAPSIKSAFIKSSIFSIGILFVMLIIGLITTYLGRMLGDLGNITNILGALLFLIVALLLADIIHLPQASLGNSDYFRNGSYISIFILGLLFGTVLGPCAFAFLMPVLGLVFNQADQNPIYAYSLLLAYGIGHSILIVLAGTTSGWVQKYSKANQKLSFVSILRKIIAILCFLIAIWFALKIF